MFLFLVADFRNHEFRGLPQTSALKQAPLSKAKIQPIIRNNSARYDVNYYYSPSGKSHNRLSMGTEIVDLE